MAGETRNPDTYEMQVSGLSALFGASHDPVSLA